MSLPPPAKDSHQSAPSKCFARSVVDALCQEPGLEAVTINRARKTISVATLGKSDEQKLSQRLTAIQNAQAGDTDPLCALFSGKADCLNCDWPLSAAEQKRITIQHEGDKTTIARVTCPTAPRFWRWRDIPFPKVVQRDVEFLEHAEQIEEWKPQLLAAVLCGALGL